MSVITDLLNKHIAHAGLDSKQNTAKCFRPTGAPYATCAAFSPQAVMMAGRWKTESVFLSHYVHEAANMLPCYTMDTRTLLLSLY